jgi:hypothetical protein
LAVYKARERFDQRSGPDDGERGRIVNGSATQ